MQILSSISINTIILTVVGVILAIQQWQSGSSKINKETLSAYRDQVALNKETIKSLQDQVNVQAKEIGTLEGINKQKDNTVEEYKKLIQGRNPQIEDILKKVADFMEALDKRLQTIEQIHTTPTTVTTQISHPGN